MIIDGKAIAASIVASIKTDVVREGVLPRLTVFTCAPNFETQTFLRLKQQQAQAAGIQLTLIEFPADSTLSMVSAAVATAVSDCDGIIIQFPFPDHIPNRDLLPLIPASHDVDALSYEGATTPVLPPVVGAIDAISSQYDVVWEGKSVVVVGNGRLVGSPAASYARSRSATVTVLTKDTLDQARAYKGADILILGAGVPGLVTPDMVTPGVVVFDAGTSEEGGLLVGDAASDVASVASVFTPVPGGIGPITIAILLKNVLYLALQHRKNTNDVV